MQKQVNSTFTATVCHCYIITRGVAFLQKNHSETSPAPILHTSSCFPAVCLSLSGFALDDLFF